MNTNDIAQNGGRKAPAFAYDGYGERARIGLIFMASSVVMENEMWAMAPRGVSVHTTRIKLPKVNVEGIQAMMDAPQLEEAARLLASAPIDVLCFGGTSGSFLHGTAYDEALTAKLKNWAPGIAVNTASTGSLAALKALDVGPVVLATPYVDAVHERAIRWLGENGHEVLASDNLRIDEDQALAEVPLEKIFDMVCAMDHPDAEAVFISCTNFRSAAVIGALEEELGKPVVSAVQASFWHALRLAGVEDDCPDYGRLFRCGLPGVGA
ncbi:maleate cis-trans isomerase family protein [Roseivivax sediminis]|uniref:Maleate isomerase n=1 Tax=Roseivivax sediminis TaxID=936889 RepID=A0A1I1WTQ7_9RHOB|nr:Asp/Glu racemase [Roseivivax sediminis]SFD97768.1 maleate isomerase [Roseivivax sediminis]